MKKVLCAAAVLFAANFSLQAQEYKVITSVESIVSSGLGRSRIINALEDKDYRDYTSVQTKDDNTRNKSNRSAVTTSMINDMIAKGWELAFVNSAVDSDGGDKDGQGIFITRYIFKR